MASFCRGSSGTSVSFNSCPGRSSYFMVRCREAASSRDTHGPPNGQPVPWVRSMPIPRLSATDTVYLNISCHRGDRYGKYRSEEHTSELQSRENLVCRLLL